MKPSRQILALSLGAVVLTALSAVGADAVANWSEHCAKCHGETGRGDTKMGKKLSIADLTDAAVQAKFTDQAALKAMKEGVSDKSGKVTMKPVEGLSADEMTALVKHVRALQKK